MTQLSCAPESSQRGDAAVLGAVGLVLAIILTVVFIDMSCALIVAVHEDNALEVAADSVAQPEFQMVLKNSSDWNGMLADRICDSLASYGYEQKSGEDAIRIAMYEQDPEDERYRIIVWSAEITQTFYPVWIKGSGGDGGMQVSRVKCGTIILYSSSKTYGRDEALSSKSGYAVYKSGRLSTRVQRSATIDKLCGPRGADMQSASRASSEMKAALSSAQEKCR